MPIIQRMLCVMMAGCLCFGCREAKDPENTTSDTVITETAEASAHAPTMTKRREHDVDEEPAESWVPVSLIKTTVPHDRVLIVDQLEQSLARQDWSWTYLHGYQEAMDDELLRDVQALILTPENVFFTELQPSPSPPAPFYKEYTFTSFEGLLTAQLGERLLEAISAEDRKIAKGCCLGMAKVTMNEYPIYYFRLRLSRSGTDPKGGAA